MRRAIRFGIAALALASMGLVTYSEPVPRQQTGVSTGMPDPLVRSHANRMTPWVRWVDAGLRADLRLDTYEDPQRASRWISVLGVTATDNDTKGHLWRGNSSTTYIRLPFIPTSIYPRSPKEILIAGKEVSRTWGTVLYRYELTTPEVLEDGLPGPVRVCKSELVWHGATAGQDMIRSMRPMLGDDGSKMLVEFWDSRDVWVLDLEAGELVTRVLDSTQAPESENRDGWRLSYGFSGDHFDEGFIYSYTGHEMPEQGLDDCVGVYFRDLDRDGTIDDFAPLTFHRSVRLGLTDREKYR